MSETETERERWGERVRVEQRCRVLLSAQLGFVVSVFAAPTGSISCRNIKQVRRRVWHKLPRHLHSISTGASATGPVPLWPLSLSFSCSYPLAAWQHFNHSRNHTHSSVHPFTHSKHSPNRGTPSTPLPPYRCAPRHTLVLHAL